MESKELLQMNLRFSSAMTFPMLKDMADAPLTFPTSAGGNHPLWIAGHLAYVDAMFTRAWMLGEANPLAEWAPIFGEGTSAVDDASAYPPIDELLATCRATRDGVFELLESMTEADLDASNAAVPEDFAKFFPTRRHLFLALGSHWWTHRGQLADARRAAGRERLGH